MMRLLLGLFLCVAVNSAADQRAEIRPLQFNVDDLFNGNGDPESPDEARDDRPEEPPSLLESLQRTDPLRVGANIRLVAGYSPGWSQPLGGGGEYQDLPIIDLRSRFDLLVTVSPALSFSQKITFEYPDYDPELTELALDYTVQDAAFLTLGLRRINWGRSPNFPFTNVLQRRADRPIGSVKSMNTIVGRAAVPVGVGGFEAVLQNKQEYQENIQDPRADRVGAGIKYNYARPRMDIDVGGYYQRGLKGRVFVAGSTTLTDWLELYAEGLMADARLRLDDTTVPTAGDNNPDFGVGLGVVVGLLNTNLELNGEYFYNGEEAENEVAGYTFPLFWGHNLALNADYRIPHSPLRLRMGYRHNSTAHSGLLVPRVTVSIARHMTFDITGGLFFGPADAGYRAENPDDRNRPAFVSFAVTISGGI